jgi:hypothetical protein
MEPSFALEDKGLTGWFWIFMLQTLQLMRRRHKIILNPIIT